MEQRDPADTPRRPVTATGTAAAAATATSTPADADLETDRDRPILDVDPLTAIVVAMVIVLGTIVGGWLLLVATGFVLNAQPRGRAAVKLAKERLEITLPPSADVRDATIDDWLLVERMTCTLSLDPKDLPALLYDLDQIYSQWSVVVPHAEVPLNQADLIDADVSMADLQLAPGMALHARRDGGSWMELTLTTDELTDESAVLMIDWFWDG